VIILSAHHDGAYVESAAESGAVGFLLKQDCARDVCGAIRKVQMGKTFFSSSVSPHLKHLHPQSFDRIRSLDAKFARLSSREMEVLQLIAEGNANKETASELGIGIKTVERHREHIMEKLDNHNTAGLTRYAVSAGIIESSVQVTIV
jgi:DNA-binding NarL/FixJ family response regulator